MQEQNNEKEILLPHHVQQSLCTTRLPYRQGRKLTAVKVYSISKESNHLLIFGVPSLNLRQETKALFIRFGKLLKFNISKEHASESFTETYHAQYERIHSARLAKRMLDTKNFYGGVLHVCYAPELEDVNETRQKLMQRQRDVVYRLRNLSNEQKNPKSQTEEVLLPDILDNKTPKSVGMSIMEPNKLNMGDINTISYKSEEVKVLNKKRKIKDNMKFQPCFIDNINKKKIRKVCDNITECHNVTLSNSEIKYNNENNVVIDGNNTNSITTSNITEGNVTIGNHINDIEVIDCTGVNDEVITNINECLNYNNFGGEIIRKVPSKPVNKIQFHLNKKS